MKSRSFSGPPAATRLRDQATARSHNRCYSASQEHHMTRHGFILAAGTLALGLSACGPSDNQSQNGSSNAQSRSTAPATSAPTGSATVGSSAGTPTNGSPYDQPAGTNSKPANGASSSDR
jgi:hypothetical protein